MMKSIVHKLREQEIYCITFNRVFYEKLKPCGKPHKDMRGMPKNWASLTKEQCCEMVVPTNHYAMAILTGAISNLTVIDFDIIATGHTSYEKFLEDFPELKTCKTVKSCSGGYHIYCRYDPEVVTGTDCFKGKYAGVDIRNDKACIIAPPTKLYFVDENKTATVKGEYSEFITGEILPFPPELKRHLTNLPSAVPKSVVLKKRLVTEMETNESSSSSSFSESSSTSSFSESSSTSSSSKVATTTEEKDLSNYKRLEYFLTNGFNSENYEHKEMCRVGYAIRSMFGIAKGLPMFLAFAKKYSKNNNWEQEYTDKFEKYMDSCYDNDDWNMGWFINLFKKKNKELYEKLNKQYYQKEKQEVAAEKEQELMQNGNIHVTDDNDAATYILLQLEGKIVYCRGQLFFKNDNIWINSKPTIDSIILDFILTARMYKCDGKKETPYGQNVKNAKNIREAFYCKITKVPDDGFYEKFHVTTKGRLAFLDGVLDFKTKTFYTWEEVTFEYFTTQQINRNFREYFQNPNREVIELVKNKIYDIAFGEKVDLALHFLSRGIAGHNEDKNWATYIGNRDCGKGVIYDSLVNAFEGYVKSFELSMIQYQRKTSSDETSRKMYWLLDLEFVRLGINQEIPSHEQCMQTCGKTLKKMTGGNDDMIARRNYDRVDTHFKIDTTFLMMGNNGLLVDTNDAFEHRIEFNSVIQFKTQEEIDQMRENGVDPRVLEIYKIKDDNIKTKCTSEDWRNAMVFLLFENYKTSPVSTAKKSDDIEDDHQTLRQLILEKYELTGVSSDVLPCITVGERLGIKDSKKLAIEMNSMHVQKKKSKAKQFRDQLVFVGIKEKPQEVEEDDRVSGFGQLRT